MKIVVGSDHAGYEMKEYVKTYLNEKGFNVLDVGTNGLESVDYPLFGEKVGKTVLAEKADFGIVMCGTGIGISIAANKVKGIRAALVHDANTARLAREHNNANVLAFGGRNTTKEMAKTIVDEFMNAKFEERHQNRLDLISEIENE